MVLYKEDLEDLGHTGYPNENGNLVIVSDGTYLGIERIMLRNILLLFGDYEIVAEDEVMINDDGDCNWEFITNLPWSKYEELWKSL